MDKLVADGTVLCECVGEAVICPSASSGCWPAMAGTLQQWHARRDTSQQERSGNSWGIVCRIAGIRGVIRDYVLAISSRKLSEVY